MKLLSNPEIYAYVSKSIRRSGDGAVHDWLMTKNYKDFLVNPKWGEDGPFLAMSLTKLVQKTENVVFKNGGGHVSKKLLNSSESVRFHQGLSKVIDNCSTKEELFLNVRQYAQSNLKEDSYKEFSAIFNELFYVVSE